jgi:hypothetical protein
MPAVIASPVAPGLAVAAGGIRMPETQLASLQAPDVLADDLPVSRVGSEREGSAFLPTEAPVAPVVPVYPRKQARH